jgi:hypothetical protein
VQSAASSDIACAEKDIHVTPMQPKGTYRAEGCGKKATYVCEGWDSYDQKPICTPK